MWKAFWIAMGVIVFHIIVFVPVRIWFHHAEKRERAARDARRRQTTRNNHDEHTERSITPW